MKIFRSIIFVFILLLLVSCNDTSSEEVNSLAVVSGNDLTISLDNEEEAHISCIGNLSIEVASSESIIIRCGNNVQVTPTSIPSTPTISPTETIVSNLPVCAEHNSQEWHALIKADETCHYNHEHKDDPHLVDDVFGPVAALYGGQELSYPWQTFKGAGEGFPEWDGDPNILENAIKHEGYGWLARKDMGCYSRFGDGCLTDFRLQYHAIMAAHGAVTRFHSYWLEARGCLKDNPDVCGIIRFGGWQDFGYLLVDGEHVPLPGDPAQIVSSAPRRLHRTNNKFSTWYGKSSQVYQPVKVNLAIQTGRTWGPVLSDNPFELHFFCPDNQCENPKMSNGSNIQAHLVDINIDQNLDTDGDGLVDFDGYVNRYGEIVNDCTEVGLDCVPLQIIGMPVGEYQYRDDAHAVGKNGNGLVYDTSPPGEFWITYPN